MFTFYAIHNSFFSVDSSPPAGFETSLVPRPSSASVEQPQLTTLCKPQTSLKLLTSNFKPQTSTLKPSLSSPSPSRHSAWLRDVLSVLLSRRSPQSCQPTTSNLKLQTSNLKLQTSNLKLSHLNPTSAGIPIFILPSFLIFISIAYTKSIRSSFVCITVGVNSALLAICETFPS